MINAPHLDGNYDINMGLRLARKLRLDLIIPQYIADVIAWTAIGACATESHARWEMVFGLSIPIRFKNSTDGSLIVTTTINSDGHLVLRGGSSRHAS